MSSDAFAVTEMISGTPSTAATPVASAIDLAPMLTRQR
jgi:hypothetical protein